MGVRVALDSARMARLFWPAAIVLVVVAVALFWLWPGSSRDSESPAATAKARPLVSPAAADADGGQEWQPHPDRAGVRHRPSSE
jgi:hypothetical protein